MAETTPTAAPAPPRARTGRFVGALLLAIPLAGLVLLRSQPALDSKYEHDPAHFWLVLAAAVLSAIVAYGTGSAASRRGDVRAMYLSLTFLSASGFLALHALATPHVLLPKANAGFNISTPVGIIIGSVFAAASVVEVPPERNARALRTARVLRIGLLVLMAVWAGLSLWRLPPFDRGMGPERASGAMLLAAIVATGLYLGAAVFYFRLWSRRGGLLWRDGGVSCGEGRPVS